jgi:hypothetical protein
MGARRGTLALVAADGAVPVSPGAALLEEMLAGWRCQQQARRLTRSLRQDDPVRRPEMAPPYSRGRALAGAAAAVSGVN